MQVGCSFNMFSMSSEQIDDNHNQRINITELENTEKDIPLLVYIYIEFLFTRYVIIMHFLFLHLFLF